MTFEQWMEVLRVLVHVLSGVAIPYVIFIVGNKLSNIRQREENLRDKRIEIYNKILEPFFLIFTPEAVIENSKKYKKDKKKTRAELASEKLLTIEYQDYAFKLRTYP